MMELFEAFDPEHEMVAIADVDRKVVDRWLSRPGNRDHVLSVREATPADLESIVASPLPARFFED